MKDGIKMIENCAYYVDNLFYGYQVYCTHPTEFWLKPMSFILIVGILLFNVTCYYERKIRLNKKCKKLKLNEE